ncbi:uncharacterized protein LOC126367557 [Pectinophora gossypiella]|nr:uncharacterized protein LOC126367557 [Pectinophora gossypiella]
MWGWSRNITDWNEAQLNLLQSSWRSSTRRTYKVAWNRWLSWCELHRLDPFKPTGSILAKFLADLFLKDHLSYNTILLHKSVVATLCDTEISGGLSSHVLVKHVLKSISLKKPVQHKTIIWDTDILTSFLSIYSFDENNIFSTSRHAAILLLLCSGRRVHDLTLLAVDKHHYMEFDDHIIMWPLFGSKTDNGGFRQSGWKILANSTNKQLDAVYWVKRCVQLLHNRRHEANCSNLFVNLRGQPKAASQTIIAGWIKTLLSEANISAPPGSVRSAVASKSRSDNVSVDEILSRGNWKSGNTFQKFYRREVISPRNNHLRDSFVPVD